MNNNNLSTAHRPARCANVLDKSLQAIASRCRARALRPVSSDFGGVGIAGVRASAVAALAPLRRLPHRRGVCQGSAFVSPGGGAGR
eukprot:1713080-Alexandrium_andersonii.AAC.1